MKYFFQHFIIFMVVLSVIGMANAFATVYLEKKHDGDIVKLAPGDALIITLKSNPTTGYSWNVVDIDFSILKPGKTEFRPISNLLGAPGKEILYFTALSDGEIKLVLGYRRPWEKGVKPLNTFYVIVKVITPNPAH
jgi:inhibitor of cysteine peptidase